MTDKAQKIREEVERLMNELIQEKEKGFDSDSDDACILELLNVLTYIDSLQEEPAPKILEDMLNAKTPAESLGISQEEHDRIVDELIYGKEPEMVDIDDLPKEEPVTSDFEAALAKEWKGYNDRGAAKVDALEDNTQELAFAKGFYRGWHSKKEEPASEDLEEASKEWLAPQLDKSYANYGEAKMMELTKFDGYAMLDAIEFGANWQKEQMMKDAVVSLVTDVIIHNDGDEVKYSVAYPIGKRPFNKGDKVKVIVIKED